MMQRRAVTDTDATILGVAQSAQDGAPRLNLAAQLAEVLRNIEDNARETEARSNATDIKLREASKALAQAQSHIAATEDRLMATEERAQHAEAEAREATQELALVEEALRRLLCAELNQR
jgi:chromosome segregation ATPase